MFLKILTCFVSSVLSFCWWAFRYDPCLCVLIPRVALLRSTMSSLVLTGLGLEGCWDLLFWVWTDLTFRCSPLSRGVTSEDKQEVLDSGESRMSSCCGCRWKGDEGGGDKALSIWTVAGLLTTTYSCLLPKGTFSKGSRLSSDSSNESRESLAFSRLRK